ncbi:MAG: imidazole glycerol phosphate synthase subunit HisH [Ferruginibacter sp.]
MIAIIKYNGGNTRSVQNALSRLHYESFITDNVQEIRNASHVILPGVGEASSAMAYLKNKKLDTTIKQLKQPFLGICLGLQLMCTHSEENDTTCLGIFDVPVKKFPPVNIVPHMGWNNLTGTTGKLFASVSVKDDMYFVHSFYAEKGKYSIAGCEYILPFSAAMQKDNFYATQFHPERSGIAGEQIIKNFLSL